MREPVPNGDLFGGDTRTYAGNGYAADPGTGPAGETCGSCANYEPGRFKKCGIGRKSNGPGTDILKSAPACHRWVKAPEPAPKPVKPRARDRTTVAELAKAAGMKRARKRAEKAREGWAAEALQFLKNYAFEFDTTPFLAEDVVILASASGALPPPPDARAWGSVFSRAARLKIIVTTGEYRRANTSNRSPKPLWRRATPPGEK